jgi:hypothetical protein
MHRQFLACTIIGSAFLVGAAGAATAEETRVQHREWMRKFSNPGGSLNGVIAVQEAKIYRVDSRSCDTVGNKLQLETSEAC